MICISTSEGGIRAELMAILSTPVEEWERYHGSWKRGAVVIEDGTSVGVVVGDYWAEVPFYDFKLRHAIKRTRRRLDDAWHLRQITAVERQLRE